MSISDKIKEYLKESLNIQDKRKEKDSASLNDRAYFHGKHAHKLGHPESKNPYHPESNAHYHWKKGYQYSKDKLRESVLDDNKPSQESKPRSMLSRITTKNKSLTPEELKLKKQDLEKSKTYSSK